MKKFLMILPAAALVLSLGACTPAEQNAALGAAGGAAVGAAVSSKKDRAKGALIGAAVGVVASQYIGKTSQRGQCRYRDSYGREYIDRCPN